MSVRFDANGDYVTLPTLDGPFTIAYWLQWKGDGGYNASQLYYLIGAVPIGILYDPDNTRIQPDNLYPDTPTTDAWYYVTHSNAGGTGSVIKNSFTASGSSITLTSAEQYGVYDSPKTFYISGGGTPNWMNASIANIKMWTAVLTDGELNTEKASKAVVRTADLYCDAPLDVHTDLEDKFSTHDWTAAGTLSTDADDPPWEAGATITPGSIWPTVTM